MNYQRVLLGIIFKLSYSLTNEYFRLYPGNQILLNFQTRMLRKT